MKTINLYSYVNPFVDDKMRPGFVVQGKLLVLTSVQPKLTPYVEIDSSKIESIHFKSTSPISYITTAYNSRAVRFNNVSGGCLLVDDTLRSQLEDTFALSLEGYLILHRNSTATTEE